MATELRFEHHTTVVEVLPLQSCPPDLSILGEPEVTRYRAFRDEVAADRYLRRQSELRRRLAPLVDRNPADLRFGQVANQKPVLQPDRVSQKTVHFNISSSGDAMAIAIDATKPVGVDIELRSEHPGLSASSLAPALHPNELRMLAKDVLDEILMCWVYKEAWIKWSGEGMRADLKGLHLWSPGLPAHFVRDGRDVRFLRSDDGDAWVGLVT